MNRFLLCPVKDVMINQGFGENALDWYKQWGMIGHNGIDFETRKGITLVRAAHNGTVIFAGNDNDSGMTIEIVTSRIGDGFKTVYYHLDSIKISANTLVEKGKVIAIAGNTGKYTTGPHLHFGLKEIKDGNTINFNNGYKGAINPADYFEDPDWDKTNAYKRYGRKRTWASFTKNEIPVSIALTKYLKRKPTFEQINACVYGAWDREAIKDDAMAYNWKYLTKNEYQNGVRAFT